MSTFTQLLNTAKAQAEPQRLLFLIAKTESTTKSKNDRHRGTVSPVMCVDKLPEELTDFKHFTREADRITKDWDLILIAGISGENGQAPDTDSVEPVLNKMANDLMQGQELSRYLILDRNENRIEIAPH